MDYKPEVGEMFEAIDKNNGKTACGRPCKVTAVKPSAIYATDKNGAERVFTCDMWRFRKIEGGRKSYAKRTPKRFKMENP